MIDISIIARDQNLPPEKVQRTIELLDDGNTIPFITRFRKDETGGLNEEQILSVKNQTASLRALAERKAFVLKSIESQGKLTDELKVAIDKAKTSRAVEDAYLPFKPRKKSRAQEARQKGLGPLAEDIFNGTSPEIDLATRATDYVRVDKGLTSVDDVIRGVSDLLAERFADNVELRQELRKLVNETGKLTAQSTVKEEPQQEGQQKKDESAVSAESPQANEEATAEPATETKVQLPQETEQVAAAEDQPEVAKPAAQADPAEPSQPESDDAVSEKADSESTDKKEDQSSESEQSPSTDAASESVAESTEKTEEQPKQEAAKPADPKPKAKKKKKKKKAVDDPFKDYHNFKQPLKKFPPHRVLAVNRGERARKLKVKIECDESRIYELAVKKLVPEDHPFADHLKSCVKDALSRLILPSLERETRRQLTEAAEKHAVEVFANNLKNLLLQPPIRNRRVLAIDPGYKRGCSVAILEKNGEVIHSDHVFVVGNQTRRDESKKKIADLVKQHSVDLVAIGNGAACKEAEQMVSDCIANHLAENTSIRYVMVNEAGASVYSTSEVGREELPDLSPAARSAVSIGRRLQDPMSELVKISPANIGVGMYQHDVKAKHLGESLNEVVQFCVNRVGVDLNSASPSLLSYVSGLNSLTARRLVEHRTENGCFKNRQQLKEVGGVGDATFVQIAGFLRIAGGDCPLDSTSIHPESYPVAEQIIQKVDATPEALFPQEVRVETVPKTFAEPGAAKEEPAAATAEETATPEETATTPDNKAPVEESPVADTATESSEPSPAAAESAPVETVKKEVAVAETPQSTPPVRPKPSPEVAAARKKRREIVERIAALNLDELAREIPAGKLLLTDIVRSMKRPDWDPREKTRKPVLRRGMLKTDDLTPGMELEAQVVNVVDFGVFVDIGLGESCLVHVSQLSNRFIRDPQVVYAVGDVIRTWVAEIDAKKRRVKLTAIRPGTEKSKGGPRRRRGEKRGESSGAGSASNNRSRKPRRGGRDQKKRSGFRKSWKPKSAPKPVTPITDEMLAGDAPMTSFSDLAQFVKKKPKNESDEK